MQQLTRIDGLQNHHNKWVMSKYVQINELAKRVAISLHGGLLVFDLYIQYSGLGETNTPTLSASSPMSIPPILISLRTPMTTKSDFYTAPKEILWPLEMFEHATKAGAV
jgi:hypothetical protein